MQSVAAIRFVTDLNLLYIHAVLVTLEYLKPLRLVGDSG